MLTTDAAHGRFNKSSRSLKSVAYVIGKNEKLLNDLYQQNVQIFVLDRYLCKREGDDMRQAIIYHYPSISSEDQVNFIGQLLGISQFLASTFAPPQVLALGTGTFAVYSEERFFLAVGHVGKTSEQLVVAHRDYLVHLITTEYGSLDSLYGKLGCDRDKLEDQLAKFFQLHLGTLGK